MNRRTMGAVLLATVLAALAACGSAEDDSAPQGSVTPEQQRASTGPQTACTVIGRDAVAPLNPQGEELVNTLLIGDLTFDGCTIGTVPLVSFGIKVVEGGDSLEERVENLGDGTLEEIEGLGDEAFRSEKNYDGRSVLIAIGVRQGEHEILLRNESLGEIDEKEQVTEEATIEFLEEYVAAIPDDFESEAPSVLVGAGCPAEIDPAVTALVGNVALARGGHSGQDVQCRYLGDSGSTIQLSRFATDNAAGYITPKTPPEYVPVPIEGATAALMWLLGNVGNMTIQPSASEIAELRVESAGGAVEQERFLALATTFLSESAP